jgi:predicted Zn-dependent protease with MMP-like domain
MFEISNERFEELAAEAVASLPQELSDEIDNVAIVVEDEALGRSLFGLYEGVPLTKRGGADELRRRPTGPDHFVSKDHLSLLQQRR